MISRPFDKQSWKSPPWVVFPTATPEMWPRPDAWRAYSREWQDWFCSLTREERRAYELHFPEPDEWHDFYRFVSNEEW